MQVLPEVHDYNTSIAANLQQFKELHAELLEQKAAAAAPAAAPGTRPASSVEMAYSMNFAAAELVSKRDVPLSEFAGRVALVVNFGNQELKTDELIRGFVDKYGVKFPMFAPVEVNGKGAHPLWKFINPESNISWNFAGKFLLDQSGQVVKRYTSSTPTATIEADVRALLAA
ncbi:thioredoxin-like protein [Pavlovales sp. CCMP2436]|nr:thioredoxin-like protein [Pavlovales sp. CCMP2436]